MEGVNSGTSRSGAGAAREEGASRIDGGAAGASRMDGACRVDGAPLGGIVGASAGACLEAIVGSRVLFTFRAGGAGLGRPIGGGRGPGRRDPLGPPGSAGGAWRTELDAG